GETGFGERRGEPMDSSQPVRHRAEDGSSHGDSAKRLPANQGLSRRAMLGLSGLGFGSLALNVMLSQERARAADRRAIDLRPRPSDFDPQARAVIMLMQNGGPSQMELFDPKPDLDKYHGKQHSLKVEMFQAGSEQNTLLKSVFAFRKHGQCGMELSEVIPQIG